MITNPLLREKIERMQSRAKNLGLFGLAPDGKSTFGEYLNGFFTQVLATDSEAQDNDQELGKLFKRAHMGDLDARTQLNELVIEVTTNYVIATMNFGSFFEIRTLQPNQSPAIQNNTRQEIKATYVGQDGETQMTKVIKPQRETTVDLHELVSEEVNYRMRDIYTGDVQEAARATFDIAFDLANQIETILFALLIDNTNGALGTFDITNANKAARVYHPHSRVLSGVLPTTNDVSIASVSGSTKFGFTTFDEIIDYCVRFAKTTSDGDLRPTGEVIVASQDVREVAAGITPTNARAADLVENILKQGWYDVGDYMGVNWRVVPDNTIARKKCYARLNKPVGILWLKPSMDSVEETVQNVKNIASRVEGKVIGAAIPTPNKRNIVRVAYRT